jgi:hypothetical protein
MIFLEEHIRAIADLVGDETHEVTRELGNLLEDLWTRVGGNRSRLTQMVSHVSALKRVGNHTNDMRSLVWRVRQELDGLQKSTDVLRDIAAEPLLLDGPLPRSIILQQLSKGCQELQYNLVGLNDQIPIRTLRISAGG